MITAEQVRNQIQSLINTANEKTGNNDADLTSAVSALVGGYGGGDSENYYDVFWDNYLQNGKRDACQYMFSGIGWNEQIFKPKYSLKPLNASYMFASNSIANLYEVLDDLGITIDFSNTVNFASTFNSCGAERIGVINLSALRGSLSNTFASCKAYTIDKIIFNENVGFSSTFTACYNLTSLHAEGVIGKSMNISWSLLLNNESVQSIIDCLKDLTGATAQTLNLHADVKARLTEEQLAAITSKNWTLA